MYTSNFNENMKIFREEFLVQEKFMEIYQCELDLLLEKKNIPTVLEIPINFHNFALNSPNLAYWFMTNFYKVMKALNSAVKSIAYDIGYIDKQHVIKPYENINYNVVFCSPLLYKFIERKNKLILSNELINSKGLLECFERIGIFYVSEIGNALIVRKYLKSCDCNIGDDIIEKKITNIIKLFKKQNSYGDAKYSDSQLFSIPICSRCSKKYLINEADDRYLRIQFLIGCLNRKIDEPITLYITGSKIGQIQEGDQLTVTGFHFLNQLKKPGENIITFTHSLIAYGIENYPSLSKELYSQLYLSSLQTLTISDIHKVDKRKMIPTHIRLQEKKTAKNKIEALEKIGFSFSSKIQHDLTFIKVLINSIIPNNIIPNKYFIVKYSALLSIMPFFLILIRNDWKMAQMKRKYDAELLNGKINTYAASLLADMDVISEEEEFEMKQNRLNILFLHDDIQILKNLVNYFQEFTENIFVIYSKKSEETTLHKVLKASGNCILVIYNAELLIKKDFTKIESCLRKNNQLTIWAFFDIAYIQESRKEKPITILKSKGMSNYLITSFDLIINMQELSRKYESHKNYLKNTNSLKKKKFKDYGFTALWSEEYKCNCSKYEENEEKNIAMKTLIKYFKEYRLKNKCGIFRFNKILKNSLLSNILWNYYIRGIESIKVHSYEEDFSSITTKDIIMSIFLNEISSITKNEGSVYQDNLITCFVEPPYVNAEKKEMPENKGIDKRFSERIHADDDNNNYNVNCKLHWQEFDTSFLFEDICLKILGLR